MFENPQNKELLDEISRLKNENLLLKEKIISDTKSQELILFKNAFYSSKNLIALVDKNYRLLAVNDAYVNFHKKNRNQIIGSKLENVVGSISFKKVKEKIDKCLLGQTIEFEDWFEEKSFGRK
ncbi:MAG: hypothetical protein JXR68_01620 [Bacteroidales bacterium]|nr:hypothetical protein [Bacteroidales bacterium]